MKIIPIVLMGTLMENMKQAFTTVSIRELYGIKHHIHIAPGWKMALSYFYDFMMTNNIFPKIFGGSIKKHNTVQYLNSDNTYSGACIQNIRFPGYFFSMLY
jgi:hypothetical protein